MSLLDIAKFVSSEAGVPYTTVADKRFMHDRINKSALEIYINNDLPNSLQEVFISLQSGNSEIFTLPSYVYKVRGLRRPQFDVKNGMTFTNMVPRYTKQMWGNVAMDNIRIISTVATTRDIMMEQEITIELSDKQDVDVTVVVIGDTAQKTNFITSIIVPANTQSVTFSSLYTSIKSVSKKEFFYGTVYGYEEQLPGKPLFEIPAALMRSMYVKIQIQDLYMYRVVSGQYNFELLFKPKLPIMYSEDSEFIVPEIFDQCIGWWTISQYIKGADEKLAYQQKVIDRLSMINDDEMRGEKKLFNVGYNVHAEAYDRLTWAW